MSEANLQLQHCDECNYSNESEENILNHKITQHTKHYCNKCGYITESISQLINYLHDEHTTSQKQSHQFKCRKCDLSFNSKPELHTHIGTHDRSNHFPCDFCGYKASSIEVLDTHIQSFHKIMGRNHAYTPARAITVNQRKQLTAVERLENGICRQWNNGTCRFNDACKFAHVKMCKYQETCRFQSSCRFYHINRNNIVFLSGENRPQTFQLRSQDFPPIVGGRGGLRSQ